MKRRITKKQFVQFDPRYTDEQLFKDIEIIQCQDVLKTIPPLTKEEHDYYMSLAPKKDFSK